MHILDVTGESPTEKCFADFSSPIAVNPIVVDEIVYVFTQGQSIWPLPKGECAGAVADRLLTYVTEQPVDVAPAIVGDILYIPEDRFLYAKNLATNEDVWSPETVSATRPISTPPVVTQNAIYFGSEDGVVYAVDSTTGEALWSWDTGLPVRGAPAVIDRAVFIATGNGELYAVGEESS
jgi:outer membrane protein assembly factor BamB